MADNTTLNAGTGGDVIATDDIAGVKYQRVKISQGADGSATDVGIGGGTEATALRVTVANDSTGVVSVDDGGGALTVDGTVTAELSATDNAVLDAIAADGDAIQSLLTTIDADTSAAVVDLAAIETLITAGNVDLAALETLLTASNVDLAAIEALLTTIDADTGTLAVTGGGVETGALRVTLANNSTGVLSIDDNGGAITVDGAVTVTGTVDLGATDNAVLDAIAADTARLDVVGTGLEATALRVTIASDSTGVLSVDDNGGSLTVDGTVGVSGTVTVDLGANNDVTVTSGTVTANLGATDNAVLDAIAADGDAIQTVLGTIDADTGNIANYNAPGTACTRSNFTSAIDAQVVASNANRTGLLIANDADKNIYLGLGTTTVTTTSYTKIITPGGHVSVSDYTGEVRGLMAAAVGSGAVRVSEVTR